MRVLPRFEKTYRSLFVEGKIYYWQEYALHGTVQIVRIKELNESTFLIAFRRTGELTEPSVLLDEEFYDEYIKDRTREQEQNWSFMHKNIGKIKLIPSSFYTKEKIDSAMTKFERKYQHRIKKLTARA